MKVRGRKKQFEAIREAWPYVQARRNDRLTEATARITEWIKRRVQSNRDMQRNLFKVLIERQQKMLRIGCEKEAMELTQSLDNNNKNTKKGARL